MNFEIINICNFHGCNKLVTDSEDNFCSNCLDYMLRQKLYSQLAEVNYLLSEIDKSRLKNNTCRKLEEFILCINDELKEGEKEKNFPDDEHIVPNIPEEDLDVSSDSDIQYHRYSFQ